MNPSLREKCQEVLDKIKARPTSQYFLEPVDPEEDNLENYYQIIKRPSDLQTVQTKLNNGEYKDIASFKEELGLIWSNCIKYHGDESIWGTIALDLKQFSDKLLVFLTDSPDIDWINELYFLVEELSAAVKPLNFASFSGKKRSSSTSSVKQYDIQNNDDADFEEITYKYEQLEKLSQDIAAFTKESDIMALYDTLKENSPRLVGTKSFLQINICTLPSQTITALMKKVEELKNAPEKSTDSSDSESSSSSSSSRSTSGSSSDGSDSSDSSSESSD